MIVAKVLLYSLHADQNDYNIGSIIGGVIGGVIGGGIGVLLIVIFVAAIARKKGAFLEFTTTHVYIIR